jgi:hypothetical protein
MVLTLIFFFKNNFSSFPFPAFIILFHPSLSLLDLNTQLVFNEQYKFLIRQSSATARLIVV